MRIGVVVVVVVMACSSKAPPMMICRSADGVIEHCTIDARPADAPQSCDVLTQGGCTAGEKCTWVVDATTPDRIGHIGCVPDGSAALGAPCAFGPAGATGYDNCAKGLVCAGGTCTQICDQQGGAPTCDADHACVTWSGPFKASGTSPPAAGVCVSGCDPLDGNDFDGSGSALHASGAGCGSGRGCYGYPSYGTAPPTGWSCTIDVHQQLNLRHRVECTPATGCADTDGTIYVNSCSPGYEPLLAESTGVSTMICVAICAPANCYAGNCGSNDINRLGVAPHRCTEPDAVGTFDTSPGGESCRYLWSFERDAQGNFLRSVSSDAVGFCVDHGKYGLPPCASLPDGFGSGSALGAADLGCVDSTHAGLPFAGKGRRVLGDLRALSRDAADDRRDRR